MPKAFKPMKFDCEMRDFVLEVILWWCSKMFCFWRF